MKRDCQNSSEDDAEAPSLCVDEYGVKEGG